MNWKRILCWGWWIVTLGALGHDWFTFGDKSLICIRCDARRKVPED